MDTHFLPPAIMDTHFLIESVFLEFYEKTRLKIYRQSMFWRKIYRQSMFWRIEYMAVLDVHDQRA